VLDRFFGEHGGITGRSAAWHPDGKRISIYIWDYEKLAPVFWTIPIRGGEAVKSEINPELLKEFGDTASARFAADTRFSWDPSGSAIYFERTFAGATNLWKMRVNSKTLEGIGIERLTTGAGYDSGVSISPDGKKLAFSGESRKIQIWVAPFDPHSGKLTGHGEAVTSPGVEAWIPSLAPDGGTLAFSGSRGSGWQIWQKSLKAGAEIPVAGGDSYSRAYPMWSPDGKFIAYPRMKGSENSIVIWSSESREERAIPDGGDLELYGWAPDGKQLVVSKWNHQTQRAEIWLIPLAPGSPPRKITADPEYFLFQGQLSPDGHWMVFEALRDHPNGRESTIYIVRSGGSAWIRVTNSQQWDDKPRWSPDGRTIYFVSSRSGFYNIWGVRFDADSGKVASDPFRVTEFDNPALMVPIYIPDVGLSVAPGHLAVTISQSSGGIWMLNNVDD
jgi:Tol biopolymer transport system component